MLVKRTVEKRTALRKDARLKGDKRDMSWTRRKLGMKNTL
jgi:hypothetical protein